jgi:hypothetical protein
MKNEIKLFWPPLAYGNIIHVADNDNCTLAPPLAYGAP